MYTLNEDGIERIKMWHRGIYVNNFYTRIGKKWLLFVDDLGHLDIDDLTLRLCIS